MTYIDNEGLSSYLTLYNIESKSLKLNKLLWSEENIIDYAIWSNNEELKVKLKNIETSKISYYKVELDE